MLNVKADFYRLSLWMEFRKQLNCNENCSNFLDLINKILIKEIENGFQYSKVFLCIFEMVMVMVVRVKVVSRSSSQKD